jgi:hypothetical protein
MTKTNCTAANPTGITNYNIEFFARLPEWQSLAQALNNYVLAANAAEHTYSDDDSIDGQDALAAAAGHLARGIAFMDCCARCEDAAYDAGGMVTDTSAAPYATHIEDGWLLGSYRCARGHEWTCNYSLARGGW